MKRLQKPVIIRFEDLTVKLFKRNTGEYHYLSPKWGYKRAYRHNQTLYIYLTRQFDNGWIDILLLKNANRLEILEHLKNFKQTSRRYKKLTGVVG